MRKIVLFLLVNIVFFGCKPKETVVGTKLDNKTEVAIKGDWTITSVKFPGSDYLKITSFNIADTKCFEGSKWNFVSNNNKGKMELNKSNCPSYSSNITWYVNKDGNMVIKFLTEGIKAKHTDSGYVLKVSNVGTSSFQLVDKVNVGGKVVDVIYNFERI